MLRRLACAVAACALAGCGSGTSSAPVGATGSSILRLGEQVWLTSPDDDEVVIVDPRSLEVRARYPVAGVPRHLVALGGAVWVTLDQASEVARISGDGAVDRFEIPCGGTSGLAATADHVVVVCENDGWLAALTPEGAPAGLWRPRFRPSRVGFTSGRLVASGDGHLALYDVAPAAAESWPTAPSELAPVSSVPLGGLGGPAATRQEGLAVEPRTGALAATYVRVDHLATQAGPDEIPGGYGRVVDDRPRIDPRVFSDCAQRYARFDGGVRAQSGPSAVAWVGDWLWVAHRDTDTVSAHRCAPRAFEGLGDPNDAALETEAVFRVGRGPRGLALSEDGRTAWVDVGFDHAVARLALDDAPADPTAAYAAPAAVLRRSVTSSRWSATADRGRRLFFDAVDTHLTPSGVVTCGACHPGGGQDGLVWRLHTQQIAPKLRRTPPAWAARPSMAPLHWDGEFTDAASLTLATILELMEGDALLVDVGAMAEYMASVPPPFPRPVRDARAVEAGRAAFEAAGCAGCHSGASMQDGLRHEVLPPAPGSLQLSSAYTPTLLGVRARPPYLHDGRAATLRDVLTTHNPDDTHGATSRLDEADVDHLVAYLESL